MHHHACCPAPAILRRVASVAAFLAFLSYSSFGATFTISTATTAAQTLGSGAGQTGTITAAGSLSVSGGTVAVSVTGNGATLTNLGILKQTGNGRAIRDNTGVTGLVVNNGSATNSTALMQTADADVIQMNVANASVTLNNYGTMASLNASAGGSQAVDFSAISSGANIVNNYATGVMQAAQADAVRSGVNGVVYNAGLIKSTTTNGSSSDGIDAQNNSGLQVTNDASGIIEGARHGITGGALTNAVNFTATITNNLGATIRGDNGSGINFDGFNALQTATIVNHGTITGNGITGDGDGVDVDGLVNITNTGVIRSINAFSSTTPAQSEGISVGGGTITNSGTIEGLVAAGNTNAIGRGISLLGNDITTGPLAGTREAIYGNATVTNQAGGLIRGASDSGIAVDGPASGFTVTINNEAGATIQGGGTANAAIRTGDDNDTINNAGTIDGSSSGKAIDMAGGNNTLKITGGSANVIGGISGGTGGANTIIIDPGSGNTFSYSGTISNFASAEVKSGTVRLLGAGLYAGPTVISGGTLFAKNPFGSATGTGDVTVKGPAGLAGDGRIGGSVNLEAGGFIAPGDGVGTLRIGGNLNLVDSSRLLFDLGANAGASDLLVVDGALTFTGAGHALFDFSNNGITVGTYTLLNFGSAAGVDLSDLAIGSHEGFSGNLLLEGNSVSLVVTAIPEPAPTAALCGLLVFAGVLRSRVRRARPPTGSA